MSQLLVLIKDNYKSIFFIVIGLQQRSIGPFVTENLSQCSYVYVLSKYLNIEWKIEI